MFVPAPGYFSFFHSQASETASIVQTIKRKTASIIDFYTKKHGQKAQTKKNVQKTKIVF